MWRVSKSGSACGLALVICAAAAACGEAASPPALVHQAGNGGSGVKLDPPLGGTLTIGSGGFVDQSSACAQLVPATPLTRYSILDLDGSLDDLLGPGRTLASAVAVGDRRYARDLSVGFVDALRTVARERAQAFIEDSQTFEVCESDDGDDSCIQPWLREWGEQLYRRPLAPEQLEAYVVQYQSAIGSLTPAEAARNSLVSMILSPYFVMRIEVGSPGELDAYEVAARLSHFATRRSPDAALRESAASKALLAPEERLAQLRRLWSSPAGRTARAQQHLDWLELTEQHLPVELAPELRAEIMEQSRLLIDDVFENQGATLAALLTSARQPLTPTLAEYYGLPAPADDEFSFVDAEPTLASGLLSQGLFLTAYPRPTSRGLAIFRGLLCGSVPDHPATAVAAFGDGATPRERITQGIAGRAECRACHDMIDPLGFALEAFDDQGRQTGFESHASVRATSVGLTFEAADPAALGRGVGQSFAAASCAVRHYLEYALDRDLTPAIAPTLSNATQGPPPIPVQREEPEKLWVACMLQGTPPQQFSLQSAMERLVQSSLFALSGSGSFPVVAFDTSVDPLAHAAQESSLFVGAFFDQQDNEKMRAYANALSELKLLDAVGPGNGGAGGAAGAGGANDAGQPQAGAGGNGASGAP